MANDMRSVQLPAELCQAVERKFGARFRNLEEFLNFMMQEAVRDDEAQMDQAEQRMIEERLKDLGYL